MYKLMRENDNKVLQGKTIQYVEWDEDGRFKSFHDEPKVGRSIMVDPHHFSFTWLTTEIKSFSKDGDKVTFTTSNSNYILEKE